MSDEHTRYKRDTGKPRWSLFPARAMRLVLTCAELGAAKYEPRSYLAVPEARERYLESLLRHAMALTEAVQDGGGVDALMTRDEEGNMHLAAIAFNALILLDLALQAERDA